MLFNTLAYARFFAVVFVISWLVVRPRLGGYALWLGVVFYAASSAVNVLGLGVVSLCLAGTWLGTRLQGERGSALTMVAVNLLGLSVLTHVTVGQDPLTLALTALNVIPTGGALIHGSARVAWALGASAAAAWLLYGLLLARRLRLLFILGASYVFYAHWDWRFLPLIFASSTVDWLLGNAIHRAGNPAVRKRWLYVTVLVNLGVLGFFKYFNFGVDSASAMLTSLGVSVPQLTLQVALPVGISFFTFESMSYVIDVYRRELEPQKSYLEYLSFVAFFPHLVAGPIVRPRDLLPQLAGPARWSDKEASEGLFLIALGLIKKVAIGDYLALNLIDRVFDAPVQYSALECYTAVVSYAVQIYCDFSGYTDVAIGSALLLGVRFPLNFNAPYQAHNVQDFWRRWHISLSTWLRDYLYVPLGGNRKGSGRTYFNLMATMVLGGLWHGASWTFVFWGGMHGAALAVNRWWQRRRPEIAEPSPAQKVVGALFTFHFVCAAWVFFRAETFVQAKAMFTQLATLSTHYPNLHQATLLCLAVGLVTHFIPTQWYHRVRDTFTSAPAVAQGVLLFLAAVVLRKMASAESVPFVYFQF